MDVMYKTKGGLICARRIFGHRIASVMRRRFWKRIYFVMKGTTTFLVDLGKLALVFFTGFIIVSIVCEVFHKVILIEPIEMPKRFMDAGYKPQVAASQLMGNLLFIYESMKTSSPNFIITTTRPDVVVPGTGFTIRTIIGYLQSILHDPTTKITGDITEQDGIMKLHLRINGSHIEIPGISHKELEDCLTQAAYAILRETDHYILASYLFFDTDNKNIEEARKEVVQAIAKLPEKSEQKAQAYGLYGMILNEQKDPDEAIHMFNKSLSINHREPYIFLNLGNALYQKGKRKEAIESLRQAIKLDPSTAWQKFINGLNCVIRGSESRLGWLIPLSIGCPFGRVKGWNGSGHFVSK